MGYSFEWKGMNGDKRRDLRAQGRNRWDSETRRRRAAIVAAEGGIYVYVGVYVGSTFKGRPYK